MSSKSYSSAAPPLKRGWLKKLSRGGLVKNWQTRYFVLNNGKLLYYQEQLDRFPYGDILKVSFFRMYHVFLAISSLHLQGDLELFDATISKDIKKFSDKQIYIISRKGQKDLLVEADSAYEAKDWMDSIAAHIQYANSNPSVVGNDSFVDRTKCKFVSVIFR